MSKRFVHNGASRHSPAAKVAYLKTAGARLTHSKNGLTRLVAAVEDAVTAGHAGSAGKLALARRAAELHLQIAEERLERLKKADISEWEELRDAVDDAGEDLARCIRHLIARL